MHVARLYNVRREVARSRRRLPVDECARRAKAHWKGTGKAQAQTQARERCGWILAVAEPRGRRSGKCWFLLVDVQGKQRLEKAETARPASHGSKGLR